MFRLFDRQRFEVTIDHPCWRLAAVVGRVTKLEKYVLVFNVEEHGRGDDHFAVAEGASEAIHFGDWKKEVPLAKVLMTFLPRFPGLLGYLEEPVVTVRQTTGGLFFRVCHA
jgi:hypothetical protein